MENKSAKYYLFLDECGDHSLSSIDKNFPIFTLCGIILSEFQYQLLGERIIALKKEFWSDKEIILHSRDIRKCQNGFEVLFDLEIKKRFYETLNSIMKECEYTIISCSILKENYIRKYGKLNDVYGLSLSYIMERTVFFLDYQKQSEIDLHIFVERRGKKEDKALLDYYNEVRDRGTYFVKPSRIANYIRSFECRDKKENLIGLQLADLVAYPITRYVLNPSLVNQAFDIFTNKIYSQNGKQHGLKVHP